MWLQVHWLLAMQVTSVFLDNFFCYIVISLTRVNSYNQICYFFVKTVSKFLYTTKPRAPDGRRDNQVQHAGVHVFSKHILVL